MSIWLGTLAQVRQPDAPVISFVSKTISSLTWKVDNYDPLASYTLGGSGSFGSINSNDFTFTQSGLSDGTSYSITASATKMSVVSATTTSISKYTSPAQPTLVVSSSTTTSVSIKINNYKSDLNYSYSFSSNVGSASRSTDTITVTGLSEGQSVTVSVTVSLDGASASNSITTATTVSIEYLIIAGGGGGGQWISPMSRSGGGGGGGGFLSGPSSILLSTPYPITVGAGGSISPSYSTSGSDSIFNNITATGGGAGGGNTFGTGQNGGSGGGGMYINEIIKYAGGTGISGQGNPGAQANSEMQPSGIMASWGGGGGGSLAEANYYGNGGIAKTNSITGTSISYAGGGGGGYYYSLSPGWLVGGGGGAGRGASTFEGNAVNGQSNTGGGGGGGVESFSAGTGGSGIIRLKIGNTRTATFSAGVSVQPGTGSVPGYKIYTVISGSGTVTFS